MLFTSSGSLCGASQDPRATQGHYLPRGTMTLTGAFMHLTPLLYLHGFRSSPRSAKAQRVEHALRERHPAVQWCCPQLPPTPREAAALIQAQTAQWPTEGMAVVGSSL